ncbi:hypothetical protein LTR56_012998 [Elasticomyces elasticus]|nr:hypothetical protein LTR56_012998 [Elasticomyces elasticus]KAK3649282.1 hypothetical protein LTR22_013011 [Elasticomyces elasticus]KAK4928184.1 hypothetical protein LTR49_005122 [Elasticomyces elasticus]KAK5765938.1 hypothetical protein LTS12_003945 [Elasticomyces elasticus]
MACMFAILKVIHLTAAQGVVLHAGLLAANPGDNAISVVWTFDNETSIENFAVRINGEILCTSLNGAKAYLVNTFGPIAILVHSFGATDNAFDITKMGPTL